VTGSPSFPKCAVCPVVIKTSDFAPHVGVTLKNVAGGVVVTKLSVGDLGAIHLCKGDIIRAINGIPAVHHKMMVALIDVCSSSHIRIHIERSKRAPPISPHLRELATNYYEKRESFHPEWTD
jgi:hypothetical protein